MVLQNFDIRRYDRLTCAPGVRIHAHQYFLLLMVSLRELCWIKLKDTLGRSWRAEVTSGWHSSSNADCNNEGAKSNREDYAALACGMVLSDHAV